jgi:hypothetical protein
MKGERKVPKKYFCSRKSSQEKFVSNKSSQQCLHPRKSSQQMLEAKEKLLSMFVPKKKFPTNVCRQEKTLSIDLREYIGCSLAGPACLVLVK